MKSSCAPSGDWMYFYYSLFCFHSGFNNLEKRCRHILNSSCFHDCVLFILLHTEFQNALFYEQIEDILGK